MQTTAITFHDPATGRARPEVFDDTLVLGSTRDLGWSELTLEHGTSRGFEPDGVAVAGHLLSVNLGAESLPIDVKYGRTFECRTLAPMQFFVQPAGVPMVQRNGGYVRWAAIEISPAWAQRVLGRDLELTPQVGLDDAPLAALMRAMVRELATGCSSGPLYSDALAVAFAARLARVSGTPDQPFAAGALGPERLRTVRAYVEDGLAERITVDELAATAGLSVAHFSREFKRATGETPHAFIMSRRLERARRLLAAGATIADAAARAGFCDQAHLSRLFRIQYGLTPGAFRRARR